MLFLPPKTLTYSEAAGVPLQLDLYLPREHSGSLPIIIYYHGGGLFTGSKKDIWFPEQMRDNAAARGSAFVAANYRLLHPFTAKEQIEDVKALFSYLASDDLQKELPFNMTLDANRIAVTGYSAGGYMSRLAALHANPKPKALMSAFGMGGNFFLDHWFGHISFPMHLSREQVASFLDVPQPRADVPVFLDQNGLPTDSLHAMLSSLYIIQEGEIYDYLTGRPGLSQELAPLTAAEREERIVSLGLEDYFPEIGLVKAKDYPATFLYHGAKDALVHVDESFKTYHALKKAGTKVQLIVVPDTDHGIVSLETREPVEHLSVVVQQAFEFIASELGLGAEVVSLETMLPKQAVEVYN